MRDIERILDNVNKVLEKSTPKKSANRVKYLPNSSSKKSYLLNTNPKEMIKEESEEFEVSIEAFNQHFDAENIITDSINQSCNFNDEDICEEFCSSSRTSHRASSKRHNIPQSYNPTLKHKMEDV